jgi:hypothetical protein
MINIKHGPTHCAKLGVSTTVSPGREFIYFTETSIQTSEMCCIFKIIYACGHRDVIKAPCEWRDEGSINILGRCVPCENSTSNLADLGRLCMACSPVCVGQNLVDLNSSDHEHDVDSYIACDEKDVITTTVRNESHLRMRARICCVTPTPPISLGFPTSTELHYQFCVNEEFLARRLKRRYFQHHLDGHGEYQDFLEASQVHLDARASLNSSIFSVETSVQATRSTGNEQEVAAQTMRTLTADSSTQTDEIEEAVVHPSNPPPPSSLGSNDSSMTILPFSPRDPSSLSPVASPEPDNSIEWAADSRPQYRNNLRRIQEAHGNYQFVIDDEVSEFIISHEGGESSNLIEPAGETQEQKYLVQEHLAELTDFVNDLSDEYAKRGMSRPDPPVVKIPLDSPKSIARLADIRLFLGMRPGTEPLDIWNFAARNNDLMGFITDNTLPIRHRKIGQAKRPGFDRDPGLDKVLDYADEKWGLREGFIDIWNSLHWNFEALSGSGHEAPGSSTHNNDGGGSELAIDELYRTLNVTDFVADCVNIGDLNANETEQEDEHEKENKHENMEKEEEQTFQFEGRRARIPSEIDFGGKTRTPRHQARNASRLRISWTYADLENSVSSPESQDQTVSPPSSPPTSPTLQDDTVSLLSSPPACPNSLNAPVSPFISGLLSSLNSSPDIPIPRLSLEDSGLSIELENTVQWTAFQEEPESPGASDSNSLDGLISPCVFERKPPRTVYKSDSTVGKRMLGYLHQFLAMPDSKTPQEISQFIDLHPGLMKAIRDGYIPIHEPPTNFSKKLRRQKIEAKFDPLCRLPARKDRKQRFMQASLAMALKVLDWEEIDSAPLPFTPPSPWGGYNPRAKRGQPNDDDEEECDHWIRTIVGPMPNRLSEYNMRYLIKHQVKKPSPLRTMLTWRELEEEVMTAQPEQGQETALHES